MNAIELLKECAKLINDLRNLVPDGSAATEADYIAWSKNIGSNLYWNLQEQAETLLNEIESITDHPENDLDRKFALDWLFPPNGA
jgi:hypothetical protein